MAIDDDVRNRVVASLAAHAPHVDVATLASLGAGLDHAAFVVGGDLVVRAVQADDDPDLPAGDYVAREAAVLALVGPRVPLAVPSVVFADAQRAVLAYRLVPGRSLLEVGVDAIDNRAVADRLGRFVGALHRIPRSSVPEVVPVDDDPPDAWRAEAVDHWAVIRSVVTVEHHASVERFLSASPPMQPDGAELVLAHADLGAEHVLVDPATGDVTGVIDWTDAVITDPAHDLGRLLRDLGPLGFEVVVAAYGAAVDRALRDRAWFHARCALLEDLAYGLTSVEHRRYAEAARAALPTIFAGPD